MNSELGTGRPPVLLVEPNSSLRSALLTLLAAAHYAIEACDSLAQVRARTDGRSDVIALVAWQSMDGLLSEDRRDQLVDLTRRVRLVLMVPRRWERLLDKTDLHKTIAGLVLKPFEADELLDALKRALHTPVEVNTV
jgi:DNA-binding response OmpR family regulator